MRLKLVDVICNAISIENIKSCNHINESTSDDVCIQNDEKSALNVSNLEFKTSKYLTEN